MLESDQELSSCDSDSDNSNGNGDDNDFVPSITGNSIIDEAIFTHPEHFQSGFYYPLSADGEQQNGIPFETLTEDVDKDATLRVYPTSTS